MSLRRNFETGSGVPGAGRGDSAMILPFVAGALGAPGVASNVISAASPR